MSLMTEEERRTILPPGIWVKSKCDRCGRPLGAKLYYRGARGEYCSEQCLIEAQDFPETKRRRTMIKKKSMKNKSAQPAAEEVKATPIAKKNGKKTKSAAASVPPSAPEPKSKPSPAPASKKAAISNPFRPGSVLHTAFQRLLDRGQLTMAEMFEGLPSADPGRLIVDMRYRGRREGFELKRTEEGKFQVVAAG
jgi:hypothetical protein